MTMLTGGCLCGDIQYALTGELGFISHCHCHTCRKAHSAAFATTARIPREHFRWTRGGDKVANFESTPGKKRYFCSRCGSHLTAAWDTAPHVIVRIGSLDSDLQAKPVAHIWTSLKASWFDITDNLTQYETSPSGK